MNSKFTLTPSTPLPEDLTGLEHVEVHVLHSRLRRQLDTEYAGGWSSWETEARLDEVRAELDRRENGVAAETEWSLQPEILSAS